MQVSIAYGSYVPAYFVSCQGGARHLGFDEQRERRYTSRTAQGPAGGAAGAGATSRRTQTAFDMNSPAGTTPPVTTASPTTGNSWSRARH